MTVFVLFLDSVFVEAPAYLIDLMHDKNAEIRKVCDNTLDIIAVGVYLLIIISFPFELSFNLS